MKIRRDVGPLDKRRMLTRCLHCARRRIKCQGGSPCEYCTRTKKLCQPQNGTVNQVQFVCYTSSQQALQAVPVELPNQISEHSDTVYFDCFALFMQRCQFTQDFTNLGPDLLPLIQTCPPLREITMAIGAIEASRRASVNSRHSPHNVAFESYCKSIQKLQSQLQSPDALHCQGVLWCTLLLGLFELMTEVSGDGWAKHMLYGTSRIFQSRGTISLPRLLDKQLFGAFRLLEANRAILYGEDTFLSQETWLSRQKSLAVNPTSPMETVFDLVVEISSFGKFFFDQMESIETKLRPNHPIVNALARDGSRLQQRLDNWHEQSTLHADCRDPHYKLALANYHALQLFLCRSFTYYACWEEEHVPSLAASGVEMHVTAIMVQSGDILKHSKIPGILVLFPLRMGAANANKASQQDQITKLLDRISQNGFIVSQKIKVDSQELWEYQRRRSGEI